MAPFGRNFLKARLKNRTKAPEPVPGKEIQVTVCNEEKVVCGVTKHTTCADVVQALLDDHKAIPESRRLLHGDPKVFCVVERWKGFERALPPLTRILRLWNAWGEQKPFIQFSLVKTSDFVPQGCKKGTKTKGTRSKRGEKGPAQYSQSLPAERQKRLVKKAFRKLEKLHKDTSRSSQGAEEIDRMVQLIISQDHTIRGQIQNMKALDLEMEALDKQAGKETETETAAAGPADGPSQQGPTQEFPFTIDGVEQLEVQVQLHRELILQLSRDIEGELATGGAPWSPIPTEDGPQWQGGAAAPWDPADVDSPSYAAELESLEAELDRSLSTGMSLYTQTAELDKELGHFDATLASKDQECWQLAEQLSCMQLGEVGQEVTGAGTLKGQVRCCATRAVNVKHSLSPTDITDTDSDTGISSTHSQDSLSPCLDFPPPPDTDV
ncbi:ras association domain-containing protein 9 [Aplochiton taeniatus]